MDREFLESLQVPESALAEILEQNSREVAKERERADLADQKAQEAGRAAKRAQVDAAVDRALAAAGAKNSRAVKALLDLDPDRAEFTEQGEILGVAEQISALKQARDSSFLFQQPQTPSFFGYQPGEGSGALPRRSAPKNLAEAIKMHFEEKKG